MNRTFNRLLQTLSVGRSTSAYRRLLPVLSAILVALLSPPATGFDTDSTEHQNSSIVPLDCVNFMKYDFYSPGNRPPSVLRPLSFINDTSESRLQRFADTGLLASAWADLCSETGEPLFLKLTGGNSQNREHGAHGGLYLSIPRLKTRLIVDYRHLGMYSGNLETFFNSYHFIRGGSLPYADIGKYGLAEYLTAQLKVYFSTIESKSVFNNYGEWSMIPGLYIPMYRKGNACSQTLNTPLFKGDLTVSGMVDRRTSFIGHHDSTENTDYTINTTYQRPIFNTGSIRFDLSLLNEKISGSHEMVTFNSSIGNIGEFSIFAGLWNSSEPEAGIKYTVPLVSGSVRINAILAHSYMPAERSIRIRTAMDSVVTRFHASRSNDAVLTSTFNGGHRIPFALTLQTKYRSSLQQFSVDTSGGTVFAQFAGSDNDMFLGSGSFRITLPIKPVELSFRSSGNIFFGELPFQHIPFECGMDIAYILTGINTIRTHIAMTWRGPVHCRASFYGHDSTMTIPSLLFADMGISFPFTQPIFTSFITPVVTITAGPILLHPTERQPFHPFGNPMSTLISVTLKGNIRLSKNP